MKFTLELQCDNIAFFPDPVLELDRILRGTADRLHKTRQTTGKVRDANGNTVGSYKLEEEEGD